MGLLSALVAGMVGHGVLRPLLEARGVSPWRVRDSLGSLPLVLIGSALLGATTSSLMSLGNSECSVSGAILALLCVVIVSSISMIRLGLLALKKLV
jgi:hypothetical protein